MIWGVLAGTTEVDASGRIGLLILVSLGVTMLVFAFPRRRLEGEGGRPLAPA